MILNWETSYASGNNSGERRGLNEGCDKQGRKGKDAVGRYLKGKLGLGIRLGTVNEGEGGIKDGHMQQEEFRGAG